MCTRPGVYSVERNVRSGYGRRDVREGGYEVQMNRNGNEGGGVGGGVDGGVDEPAGGVRVVWIDWRVDHHR